MYMIYIYMYFLSVYVRYIHIYDKRFLTYIDCELAALNLSTIL